MIRPYPAEAERLDLLIAAHRKHPGSSHLFGSYEKRQNAASLFEYINRKKFLISYEIRNFLVETAGLEPVTSCV